MNWVIYLDLDGVLADLHQGLIDMTGDPDLIKELDRDRLFTKVLPEYVDRNGFAMCNPTKNGHTLVDRLLEWNDQIKLAILTSAGEFYLPQSEVVRQKKIFIEKHFPVLAEVPFCVTSPGADKSIMAHPFAWLIDDHAKNIDKFVTAGGNGLHYIDGDDLDEKLQYIRRMVYGTHSRPNTKGFSCP